ncbi:PspC domain-containing protein [Roseiflexus castenholzii]|uniref:Phage shock protein C, PspC n=1 Tax=Roseiflexus castenholzii (strain DSM 13941 / HLO8) TaxID=383372 RepID=A7NNP3_ROSCS|nr:PspC domain-containing protein [Roseiflexus castenholzii]ABU59184.1 phage shock protein C, PspC [Roseiflexus castenholzii DSM 13941]
MQSRLVRSRRDAVLAGVCGGLGDYFQIDPVIVRLIFVLVTLTSGIGFLLYPILWIIMPKAPPDTPSAFPGEGQQAGEQGAVFSRQAYQAQYSRQSGYAESSFADAASGPPQTGQTINLRMDPAMPPARAPRRRLNWAGIVLIGLGLIFLAEQFGIDTDIVFPLLMIVAGGMLIFRHR